MFNLYKPQWRGRYAQQSHLKCPFSPPHRNHPPDSDVFVASRRTQASTSLLFSLVRQASETSGQLLAWVLWTRNQASSFSTRITTMVGTSSILPATSEYRHPADRCPGQLIFLLVARMNRRKSSSANGLRNATSVINSSLLRRCVLSKKY